MQRKKLKNVGVGPKFDQNGITLIALIITIIVLLILAGVTINLTLGQNGIFKTAEQASRNYKEAEESELGQLDDFSDVISNTIKNIEERVSVEVGTTHTKTELTYTWEELNKVARVISNNTSIITNDTLEVKATINGTTYTVGVGDTKKVEVDEAEKIVRIIGFNHDSLVDKSAYGETNTYAGISFEFVDLITSNSPMNSEDTNTGGWGACELRSTLNREMYNKIKEEVNIKQVQKAYCATYDSATLSYSNDYLWLLSCAEIWNTDNQGTGKGYSMGTEGTQYKYYEDISPTTHINNNALKKPSDVAETDSNGKIWWLRSPDYRNGKIFCYVFSTGNCGNNNASGLIGVAPGFSI